MGRPGRKLRVGYVSADFRCHSLSYFIEPLFAHHDRVRFELYCYSNTRRTDEVTDRLRNYAIQWRDITALSDEAAARRIEEDGIDILIDLSGHTAGNRLLVFARKPAPVQLSYIGYPNTTGLAAMDLSDYRQLRRSAGCGGCDVCGEAAAYAAQPVVLSAARSHSRRQPVACAATRHDDIRVAAQFYQA